MVLVLHLAILPKRSVASAEKYRKIWTPEGSPLLLTHKALAAALEARLESEGFDAPVRIAMSYGEPPIKKALREFRELECDRIVVVADVPSNRPQHDAFREEGVARRAADSLPRPNDGWRDMLPSTRAIFARSLPLSNMPGLASSRAYRLVFSFHSIPLCRHRRW